MYICIYMIYMYNLHRSWVCRSFQLLFSPQGRFVFSDCVLEYGKHIINVDIYGTYINMRVKYVCPSFVYIYIYIYVYIHKYLYKYLYIYMYMCVCIYIYINIYTYI